MTNMQIAVFLVLFPAGMIVQPGRASASTWAI